MTPTAAGSKNSQIMSYLLSLNNGQHLRWTIRV